MAPLSNWFSATLPFNRQVTYDTRGFLDKNKDPLSQDVKVLMQVRDHNCLSLNPNPIPNHNATRLRIYMPVYM